MLYPIGIQDFTSIIEGGFVYIDKTALIHELIRTGRTYFLARPRRFGKSLLLSTLECIFKGKKALFEHLWIFSSSYDWSVYPVISLDFSLLVTDTIENLQRTLQDQLQKIADAYDIGTVKKETSGETLIELVTKLYAIGPVVILIDEYDKPILDHIHAPEIVARYRELFKSFFTNIKGLGKYLRFSFITGVTKFSQVSLFSGMNNPEDISFDPKYSALLGITEQELDHYFKGEIQDQSIKVTLKNWYNGYAFSGEPNRTLVYNPLSVMRYLKSKRLANYWFATGTPSFAFQLLREQNYALPDLANGAVVGSAIEMNHDVTTIDLVILLYQTGYLTIKDFDPQTQRYHLHFPNEEVRRSFFEHFLVFYSHVKESAASKKLVELETALQKSDIKTFCAVLNQFFSNIPYAIQVPSESYYHSLIYVLLQMIEYNVQAEVMTASGRLDLLVRLPKRLFIFEFKIGASAEKALESIKTRSYDAPFTDTPRTLVGINIDPKKRCIDHYLTEEYP